ncbi:maleylpyruvate isomerase family mycothiol-dependent enzyme [Ilumatobacter sp.]|uniref:maleylpyruvate isomerase family mycothiol-dependent enzyme n=1 Tax=Ilumatobacter sp. TaxID=1967498 RepID=UPI003B51A46C
MTLPYDPIETLQSDGIATIEMFRDGDPTAEVPDCPGWGLSDLARHLGGVWHFWGQIVSQGITERSRLQEISVPSGLDGEMLVDFASVAHNELYSALVRAGVETEVWTWTGANRTTAWVRRRMALEAAMHRFDAARALGDPYEVPTAMAADGIDEFLEWFAGRERREGERKPGGTVHLHCTDTDAGDVAGGEWYVSSLKEPSCTFTREHRKADAAVRGRAHEVLAWLWRRETDGIEILGDDAVARRFRAYTDLD